MLKYIFLLSFISTMLFAQDVNQKYQDTTSGKWHLIGKTTLDAFTDTTYSWWFNSETENYEVDTALVLPIKDKIQNYDITIIMGTWCSDSRREVPRLIKILNYLYYDVSKIKIINVNRAKSGGDVDIKEYDVKLIPTIIFYKDGEEKGRIEEAPKLMLENDLAEIIK